MDSGYKDQVRKCILNAEDRTVNEILSRKQGQVCTADYFKFD